MNINAQLKFSTVGMLVPYIYYKMNIGFCIYDFCCHSNINCPAEYYDRKCIKSSIAVNEND